MKKILVTRRLLRSNEDKLKNLYDVNLNLNDELYSQDKLIELSQGCDGILSALTDKLDEQTIGKLPDSIKILSNFAEEEVKKIGLRAPMVGHLGDGNFHVLFPYDPNDKTVYQKIREFSDLLIDKTLELDGTITGEHGVGLHKKSYLLKEHPDNIPLMKTIKRSIDPNNIMNPGKIFDLN